MSDESGSASGSTEISGDGSQVPFILATRISLPFSHNRALFDHILRSAKCEPDSTLAWHQECGEADRLIQLYRELEVVHDPVAEIGADRRLRHQVDLLAESLNACQCEPSPALREFDQ